jgi:hypothetical protein
VTTVDPTVAKNGPVCTAGTGCNADRELGDFQSVTIDGAGRANVAYCRVTQPGSRQTMFDRQA